MNKINSEEPALYDLHIVDENYSINPSEEISDSERRIIDAAIEILDKRIKHGDALCSPDQTKEYLRLNLALEQSEVFCCLWLDNRNRVIEFERMFFGTIDGASVYPREVVKSALKHNAAAVILTHNHPSGVTEPSHADEQITKRLKEALLLIEVRVLDHMIVGEDVVSFAERGLM